MGYNPKKLFEANMIALRNIVVATDFSEASHSALIYGRALARAFGATLHIVHVTENIYVYAVRHLGADAPTEPDPQHGVNEVARKRLKEQLVDSESSTTPAIGAILTSNEPALAIVQYAKEKDVDLIITGTQGRGGVAHFVIGSVAEQIVRRAPCPVLTVRHPEHEFVLPDTIAAVTQL